MRQYHQALLLVVACSAVLAAMLVRAYVQAPKPLTSAELSAATRLAVDRAVDAAIATGGLGDAEAFVRSEITANLQLLGFRDLAVHLRRPNDLNPWAAFYFHVEVGQLSVRFDIEGVRDPLLAIRLGIEAQILADPNHPYTTHGDPGVFAACLAHGYYHFAPEGPDFFARLENRTRDPYHFGLETFLSDGGRVAVDHVFLDTGTWGLDGDHRVRYGR